jgi:cytochrome c
MNLPPRVFGIAMAGGMLAIAAASLVHPWGELRTGVDAKAELLQGSSATEPMRTMLERGCGNCHSERTQWPAYSRVAPVSWLVEHDVHEGREHMNLSRWQQYSVDERIDLLSRIATQLRQAKMPPKPYLLMHAEAKLSAEEQEQLRAWARAERSRLKAQTNQ